MRKFERAGLLGGAAILGFACWTSSAAAEGGTVASPLFSAPAPAQGVTPPAGPYKDPLSNADPSALKTLQPSSVVPASPGASGQTESAPPPAYGSGNAVYTTARVAVEAQGLTSPAVDDPVTSYPFRATGKLYFQEAGGTYVCTGSLIKPGVLLTAAHCVFKFGTNAQSGYYSGWTWCPALTSSGQPYGCYSGVQARILSTYYDGTDVCTQTGVVCNDDMATILLAPVSGTLPGRRVGWYGYGWNGYSYHAVPALGGKTLAQITQLGYPQAIDSGLQMERTDAVGWRSTSGALINTVIGSAQTGGSSGGPWMVNFGTPPNFGSGSSGGSQPKQSIVGVTSYGSTTVGFNVQGASFFGSNSQYSANYGAYGVGNIGRLVHDTCTANPTYC